jgi:hypothetical protein
MLQICGMNTEQFFQGYYKVVYTIFFKEIFQDCITFKKNIILYSNQSRWERVHKSQKTLHRFTSKWPEVLKIVVI